VTVRAIAGLAFYNAFLLCVGAGVLWGIRGWRWWTELARLAGLAYLLGIASLMVLLTFELVIGIPIGAWTILFSGLLLVAAGVVAGRVRGHATPGLRPPNWRVPGLTLFGALFVAGIVVYFEALFRADRLSGLTREWDSWAFWMPKAESLYFFDRLDASFLQALPQLASYPPGLAFIQAGAFHAMGSADTTSLHVQYWFFAVGFVGAVVGLLAGKVHEAILFPILLLFLVAPSLVERTTTLYADVPLGYLIAGAALLVLLWALEREPWLLASGTILLAGAMLTKREGLLFSGFVVLAGLVVTWSDRRLWRPLLGAAVVAFVVTVPWRIWFTVEGLQGDGPDSGYLGAFSYLERVRPSFDLAVRTLFGEDLWRVGPYVAVAGIVFAAIAGAWRVAVYSAVFLGLAIVGATWATWAYTALPITQHESQNPIIRITGTTVLVLAVLTPLLLQHAWSAHRPARDPDPALGTTARDALVWRSPWLWAIVGVGLLSHPGAMLVGYSGSGLPGGAPVFISSGDCVAAPAPGRDARLVIGYATSYPEARALQARGSAAGIRNVSVEKDGCGRLRVYADDVTSAEVTRAMSVARKAALEPTVEADPDG
jgi:hypothetical protein